MLTCFDLIFRYLLLDSQSPLITGDDSDTKADLKRVYSFSTYFYAALMGLQRAAGTVSPAATSRPANTKPSTTAPIDVVSSKKATSSSTPSDLQAGIMPPPSDVGCLSCQTPLPDSLEVQVGADQATKDAAVSCSPVSVQTATPPTPPQTPASGSGTPERQRTP